MDHNKPKYEHPRPPLVSEMIILDFSAPVLGKAKHGISPFPGEFFRVAFGSNPRPHGPHMGILEGHGAPGARRGCRWCVLHDRHTNNEILGLDLCEKCVFPTLGH